MIGETVFLRPCEAPLINGMTGKWNTTGTQETREIGKNAGGCSAWIFSRNKEEDDDKAKVGKRSRFLAHLTIINAWLAFSLDEPKPNHHPWNMPMHKKIPDQQYDVIPHNKKLTYFSKILNFRSFRIQIFLIFIYKKSFIIFPDFSTSFLVIFCLYLYF